MWCRPISRSVSILMTTTFGGLLLDRRWRRPDRISQDSSRRGRADIHVVRGPDTAMRSGPSGRVPVRTPCARADDGVCVGVGSALSGDLDYSRMFPCTCDRGDSLLGSVQPTIRRRRGACTGAGHRGPRGRTHWVFSPIARSSSRRDHGGSTRAVCRTASVAYRGLLPGASDV